VVQERKKLNCQSIRSHFSMVFFFSSLDTVHYCDIEIRAKYFLPKMDQIKSRSRYHLMGDSSLS